MDFVNLMLAGGFDKEVNTIIFGGRLIDRFVQKRLAAKCANNHVITGRSQALQPSSWVWESQVEQKRPVHAMRRLVQNLPPGNVIVKLDFSNAFNCTKPDLIPDKVAMQTPGIYRLFHSAYTCEPTLTFGEHQLRSSEVAQQGDPLGSLEFCEAIHPLLTGLHSTVKVGFMDDLTHSGDLQTVERDVSTVLDAQHTGLQLNQPKCEVIMEDFNCTAIFSSSPLSSFSRITKEKMILLGVPVFKGLAQDMAITQNIAELKRGSDRFSVLHLHNALAMALLKPQHAEATLSPQNIGLQ